MVKVGKLRGVLLVAGIVLVAAAAPALVYVGPASSTAADVAGATDTSQPAPISPLPLSTAPESTPTPATTPAPEPAHTLVVAAHDSPRPENADYVGDGVDDQVEIQAAIDELDARGGGRLLFQEGNYYLSPEGDYSLYLPGNVTIEGEPEAGKDAVRLLLAEEPAKGVFQTKGWVWNPPFVKVDNITFRNLTIDVGSPQGFPREWPEGSFWQDFHVLTGSINNLLVENVSFISHNPESTAVRLFLWQSDSIHIIHSEFQGVVVWAFSNQKLLGEPSVISGGDFLFQGNTVRNTPARPAVAGDMSGFVVRDNVFYDCRDTAIDVGISPNALVERNEIHGARGNGIYSEGGHDVTIRDNVIDGVAYRNSEVPWDGFGIATSDARHLRMGGNVLIENNTITNVGVGIASRGVPGLTIKGNTISGAGSHGILISYLAQGGIDYDGIPSYADNCKVIGNTIVDFGTHYRWGRGIMLTNARYSEVSGNFIDGRDNEGAVQGIGEHYDPNPDVPEDRPDHNTMESNSIAGVRTGVVAIGPGTTVGGTE